MPKVPQINWPNKATTPLTRTTHDYMLTSKDMQHVNSFIDNMVKKRKAKQ